MVQPQAVLLALIGVTAGQGATYFTGQFYVMIFLQQAVQLDQTSVYTLILIGFIIGARPSCCSAGCPTASAASGS